MANRGALIAIFVIIIIIIIGIGIGIGWWFIYRSPRNTYRDVNPPGPCPKTNSCNNQGVANACGVQKCVFNPPGGGSKTCPCNTANPNAIGLDPVDDVTII